MGAEMSADGAKLVVRRRLETAMSDPNTAPDDDSLEPEDVDPELSADAPLESDPDKITEEPRAEAEREEDEEADDLVDDEDVDKPTVVP